jgi:uncharacterized membrane protein
VSSPVKKLPEGTEAALSAPARQVLAKLEKLPQPEQQRVLSMVMVQSEHSMVAYSGPIPPVEDLERMERVVPGMANRVLVMAEEQQRHRHTLEKQVVPAQLKQSGRGQTFAFLLGLAGITGSVWLGLAGATAVACTLATVSIGTLAVTFLVGKNRERESRAKKNEPQPGK